MDGRTLLPLEIVEALADGRTLLTGNQRAARTLRRQFDLRNRQMGLTRWEPPSILAWDAWTTSLWQRLILEGHTTKLLLNRPQEHALWRSIIAADPEWSGLRTADSLAEMAADAWGRLIAYRGESRLRSAGISADTKAFQRWATAFDRRCRNSEYLSSAQLEAALETALGDGLLALPSAGFVLVGFDRMSPAETSLAEAVRTSGVPMEDLVLTMRAISNTLVDCENEQAELEIAARWIRTHLEAHPDDRIALIVPGLDGQRSAIDRVLRATLAPEQEDLTAEAGDLPFEFSLGVPLARTPIAAAALELLRWAVQPISIERIGQLLLSPYFAGGAETTARGEFDAYELRRKPLLRLELSLDAVLNFAETGRRASRLPRLIASLKMMRRTIASDGFTTGESRPAADWTDAMRALLSSAGWNGSDDSVEFQARRKWESVLDELATLDFEGGKITLPEALDELERLATQTLFAPESRNAAVQVMGPLESAGSTFDATWFLRAGEFTWSLHTGSSPLLSWYLQRELSMPGANPAEDAALAAKITARIAGSSPQVFFSYAKESGEGHQRSSSSLAGLSLQTISAVGLLDEASPREVVALETIDDSTSLPVTPDDIIKGGAQILKLQAACGFRAFAEGRLWASSLESGETGMDARERGSVVHVALEEFWKVVRDQPTLREMTIDERDTILSDAIGTALYKIDERAFSDWDNAYIDVQRDRLLALLRPWLETELARTVPFSVKLSETTLEDVRIGPLRLKLRIDRIDETEFGDVILDYKTGLAKASSWLTDRPDEPQVPLYAVLAKRDQLAGVAFAQVRAGRDRSLHGYQTQDGILQKKARASLPLEAQVDEWRRVLTTLAENFHTGDVRVRPKSYPTTCEHCAQRILCRLDITLLEDDQPDDDQNDAETERG